MANVPKGHTHTAYAYQRLGKKHGRMLEIGSGRIDRDRDIAHVVMTRLPIGGFSGYVVLSPIGIKPEPSQPQRPDETGDENQEDDDEA